MCTMTAVPATLRLRREGVLHSRAARGDAQAFAAVYERHRQALYRYCRSILRHEEDAQDALQSTMTRAFAALQDEQRDFELRPWLFRIAHNEAIAILRKRRETPLSDEAAGAAREAGEVEDRVAEREALRVLQLDLADLSERQRAALVLRELNGLGHVEIGQVLELEPATVKQAIFEARTALFSCREGREMACHDVRRMLSDGDGRVLRGRGVRAHLRTCPDCRRFKADLDQRPQALRLLAPPLPVASAAALLSSVLGGGGTAAKLMACVAIAGGGATLAVETHEPTRPPAARAERAPEARVVPTVTSTPRAGVAATERPRSAPRARRRATPVRRMRSAEKRVTLVREAAPAPAPATVTPVATARPQAKPEQPPKAKAPREAEQPTPAAAAPVTPAATPAPAVPVATPEPIATAPPAAPDQPAPGRSEWWWRFDAGDEQGHRNDEQDLGHYGD
jgi:RNA polymerase sigma factor (sigma-70 family)